MKCGATKKPFLDIMKDKQKQRAAAENCNHPLTFFDVDKQLLLVFMIYVFLPVSGKLFNKCFFLTIILSAIFYCITKGLYHRWQKYAWHSSKLILTFKTIPSPNPCAVLMTFL
jgi:hypothetical protein